MRGEEHTIRNRDWTIRYAEDITQAPDGPWGGGGPNFLAVARSEGIGGRKLDDSYEGSDDSFARAGFFGDS